MPELLGFGIASNGILKKTNRKIGLSDSDMTIPEITKQKIYAVEFDDKLYSSKEWNIGSIHSFSNISDIDNNI